MVKFFINLYVFKFPWESVTSAWWQKYPNPHSFQVEEVDTIDRKLDKKTGSLIIRRLISASLPAPQWCKALGFSNQCYVLEETTVNPKSKEMTLKSINVTGSDLLTIQETCKYTQHPQDSNWTQYHQEAEITSFVPMFTTAVENYGLSVHSEKAMKGLTAMEELCDKWTKEGVEGFQKILNMRLDTILLMKDFANLSNQINNDFNLASMNFCSITNQIKAKICDPL